MMTVVHVFSPPAAFAVGPPFEISNVASSNITSTGATITWQTKRKGSPVPATSQVEYGLTVRYGNRTLLDKTLVSEHRVLLTGLTPSKTYHYRALSRASDYLVKSKDFTFTTKVTNVPPSITTQPQRQTVTVGQTATFSVVADGTAPLSYQWQKNGVDVSGATSASYTTPATVAGDNGAKFDCVVTNVAGSITSSTAVLTVQYAPSITTQPQSQTVTAGQTATFSVVADGNPAPMYQWQRNGVDIAGAASASYTTPATVAGDNGSSYDCIATNSIGSATSASAVLTVQYAPSITTQPADQTVTVGQTATFSVVANGTAPLSYQWRKNGVNIAGATSANYTTPATVAGDDGTKFDCVVTNIVGNVTSSAAVLTVKAPGSFPPVTLLSNLPQNPNLLGWSAADLPQLRSYYTAHPLDTKDPLNAAVAYFVWGDMAAAQTAINYVNTAQLESDLATTTASDLARWIGEKVILTFSLVYPAMVQTDIQAFLDRWDNYMTILNGKSWGGWNSHMVVNNYYWGYSRDTQELGLCQMILQDSRGHGWVDADLKKRWETDILPHFNGPGWGGSFAEGPQYGGYVNCKYPWEVYLSALKYLTGIDMSQYTDYHKEVVYNLFYMTQNPVYMGTGGALCYQLRTDNQTDQGSYFRFDQDPYQAYRGFLIAMKKIYGDLTSPQKDLLVIKLAQILQNKITRLALSYLEATDVKVDTAGFDPASLVLDYFERGDRTRGWLVTKDKWGPDAMIVHEELRNGWYGAGHIMKSVGQIYIQSKNYWLVKSSGGYSTNFAGQYGSTKTSQETDTMNTAGGLLVGDPNGSYSTGLANAYVQGPENLIAVQSGSIASVTIDDVTNRYRAPKSSHPYRDDNPAVVKAVREKLFIRALKTLVCVDDVTVKNPATDQVTFTVVTPGQPDTTDPYHIVVPVGDQMLRIIALPDSGVIYDAKVVNLGAFSGPHTSGVDYTQNRVELNVHLGSVAETFVATVLQGGSATDPALIVTRSDTTKDITIHLTNPVTREYAVIFLNKSDMTGYIQYTDANGNTSSQNISAGIQPFSIGLNGPVWG